MKDHFAEFADVLKRAVTDRNVLNTAKWGLLAECCMEHAAKHAKGDTGENNIVGMHLYHDEFSWKDYDMLEHDRYVNPMQVSVLENLIRLADPRKFTKVLFDDFALYGAMTHRLVDEKVVDKVIFTEKSSGVPQDKSELSGFRKSRRNYVGGCYGKQCVRTAASEIMMHAPLFSVRPIKDAIVSYDPLNLEYVCGPVYDIVMGTTSAKLLSSVNYAAAFK